MPRNQATPFERREMERAPMKSRSTWGDRKVGDNVGHRRDPENYREVEGIMHADQRPESIPDTPHEERVFGVFPQHPPRKG